MSKKTDKRTRLVEAADKLFYEQGVSITTLANIAALAEVPLGNVYYYFKSKDSIVLAVIEQRKQLLKNQFEACSSLSPIDRLKALVAQHQTNSQDAKAFGNWYGNLCQELCKNAPEGSSANTIAHAATDLFKSLFNWCQSQFVATGKNDEEALVLTLTLLSRLQGISLLTLVFKEISILDQQSQALVQWLEGL